MDLDNLIQRVQDTHKQYLDEKDRFSKEITEAKALSDKYLSDFNNAISEIDNLNAQLSNLKETTEEQNTKIDSLTNTIAQITSERDSIDNSFSTYKTESESQIHKLNEQIVELNKNSESFDIYANSLKNELKEKETALANCKNNYLDLENRKTDVDTAFAELKEKHNQSIEDMALKEKAIKDLEKDNIILKTSLTKQTDTNNIQLKKIDELNSIISQKDTRIVELTQQISKLTEELQKSKEPIIRKSSHLQSFIDDNLPVPEDTAAANLANPIRATKDLDNTINTPFGKVTSDVLTSTSRMIDKLYEKTVLNNNNVYPLNNALRAAESVGLNVHMGNTIMDRLCSMSKDGKPIVYYNGNMYYATISKDELKKYIVNG